MIKIINNLIYDTNKSTAVLELDYESDRIMPNPIRKSTLYLTVPSNNWFIVEETWSDKYHWKTLTDEEAGNMVAEHMNDEDFYYYFSHLTIA